ncbi:Hypothetical_protein [Hexamita inflata]|uniref:Hypothetical_protein n=1 Tax=Hexamita inflata TaxID=28002 RepID=A0AA86P3L1_9EUKA|nr:Hypothetical protein HINF_LOCUS17890 [Hexamita inflata]
MNSAVLPKHQRDLIKLIRDSVASIKSRSIKQLLIQLCPELKQSFKDGNHSQYKTKLISCLRKCETACKKSEPQEYYKAVQLFNYIKTESDCFDVLVRCLDEHISPSTSPVQQNHAKMSSNIENSSPGTRKSLRQLHREQIPDYEDSHMLTIKKLKQEFKLIESPQELRESLNGSISQPKYEIDSIDYKDVMRPIIPSPKKASFNLRVKSKAEAAELSRRLDELNQSGTRPTLRQMKRQQEIFAQQNLKVANKPIEDGKMYVKPTKHSQFSISQDPEQQLNSLTAPIYKDTITTTQSPPNKTLVLSPSKPVKPMRRPALIPPPSPSPLNQRFTPPPQSAKLPSKSPKIVLAQQQIKDQLFITDLNALDQNEFSPAQKILKNNVQMCEEAQRKRDKIEKLKQMKQRSQQNYNRNEITQTDKLNQNTKVNYTLKQKDGLELTDLEKNLNQETNQQINLIRTSIYNQTQNQVQNTLKQKPTSYKKQLIDTGIQHEVQLYSSDVQTDEESQPEMPAHTEQQTSLQTVVQNTQKQLRFFDNELNLTSLNQQNINEQAKPRKPQSTRQSPQQSPRSKLIQKYTQESKPVKPQKPRSARISGSPSLVSPSQPNDQIQRKSASKFAATLVPVNTSAMSSDPFLNLQRGLQVRKCNEIRQFLNQAAAFYQLVTNRLDLATSKNSIQMHVLEKISAFQLKIVHYHELVFKKSLLNQKIQVHFKKLKQQRTVLTMKTKLLNAKKKQNGKLIKPVMCARLQLKQITMHRLNILKQIKLKLYIQGIKSHQLISIAIKTQRFLNLNRKLIHVESTKFKLEQIQAPKMKATLQDVENIKQMINFDKIAKIKKQIDTLRTLNQNNKIIRTSPLHQKINNIPNISLTLVKEKRKILLQKLQQQLRLKQTKTIELQIKQQYKELNTFKLKLQKKVDVRVRLLVELME